MRRHMRTHNKEPYVRPAGEEPRHIEGRVETVVRDKGGTNFFLTFHSWVKDEIVRRFNDIEEIKQSIVCNETGVTDNHHSHCVVVMNEKYTFDQFRAWWTHYELPPFGDVESCKNLRQAFKYCSKEDNECEFFNIDADYLHLHTTSYLCAKRYEFLSPTSYPYCRLFGSQRKEFEDRFKAWKELFNLNVRKEQTEKITLRPWQRAVRNLLKNQDDRTVLWISDEVGNTGKSILANYLADKEDAFLVEGGSTKDLAYAFRGQKYVVFDFCRSQEEFVNYHIIECFKNGRLFSAKYESTAKTFIPCGCLCFANFRPKLEQLSADRWLHLELYSRAHELKLRIV